MGLESCGIEINLEPKNEIYGWRGCDSPASDLNEIRELWGNKFNLEPKLEISGWRACASTASAQTRCKRN
jgi:hypothetical protein